MQHAARLPLFLLRALITSMLASYTRATFSAFALLSCALLTTNCSKPAPARVIGTWVGRRDGATVPSMGLQIRSGERDSLTAVLTPLDEQRAGLGASISLNAESLSISAPSRGMLFESGAMVHNDTIRGSFSVNGGETAMTFVRTRRPQEPIRPFPYTEREVQIASVPGVTLAGTLTLPRGAGPFPAVVMVSGSGAQDRDETMFLHRPFAVIADALARKGIATLRYDDRGTAQSTGSFAGSTTEDFSRDAEAAVAFARSAPEISKAQVGLLGHSEGGLVAPMVAARSNAVSFVILLAAPAVRFDSLSVLQNRASLVAMGASAQAATDREPLLRSIYSAVIASTDSAQLATRMLAALRAEYLRSPAGMPMPSAADAARLQRMYSAPWRNFLMRYDPIPALQKLRVPVLALNGTKDVQVPAAENLRAIQSAIGASGQRDITVIALPELNHFFQHAGNGTMSEYLLIEETFAPEAIRAITDWLGAKVRR